MPNPGAHRSDPEKDDEFLRQVRERAEEHRPKHEEKKRAEAEASPKDEDTDPDPVS